MTPTQKSSSSSHDGVVQEKSNMFDPRGEESLNHCGAKFKKSSWLNLDGSFEY